jgi:diguanylate cyclase (GGDEF)-like protein
VPESILSKPSGLSTEEFQVMSTHSRVGAEILETTSMSPDVVAMVRHHHERFNGTGYPDGLAGIEIPLGARILAAVDTFESLLSRRPYRPAVQVPQVVSYLQRHAGDHFDPRVIRILVEHHAEFEEMVVAEEKSLAGRFDPGQTASADAETQKMAPPLQAVLDRIASSHMEICSLHEMAQALGKTMNIDESFMLIAAKIHRLIHFSTCAIYIFDPEGEILRPRFATGPAAPRMYELSIPLGQHVSGWAALQRRPASGCRRNVTEGAAGGHTDLEALDADPDIARLSSSLAAPLLVDDSLVGVVTLYDDAGHEYTPQEEQLLGSIARQVAPAVRTGLLFERTQEHALTDSLTGLPNSRYMFIMFDQEAAKARSQGTPLTLMVLDIDKFREINDDFGHHAGDRFLVGMAKAIRSQMRACDICIRYAGDEFVAILPGLSGQEIEAVVERMTDVAKDYSLEARPDRPVHLSLSIGYATLPGDGEDFESLIAVADSRMKQQKAEHREREADHESPVPSGTLARPWRH